jgi:Yip1 domain
MLNAVTTLAMCSAMVLFYWSFKENRMSNENEKENLDPEVNESEDTNAEAESAPEVSPADDSASQDQSSPESVEQESDASPTSGQSQTFDKGKELGQKALGSAKEATTNAVKAIKTVLTDPMGGQKKALEQLGETKALSAGIFFMVIFSLAAFLVGFSSLKATLLMADTEASVGFVNTAKLLLAALIPAVALWAGFLAIQKIFKGQGTFNGNIFLTGICLLPMTIAFLACWILGSKNLELVALFGFFGFSITVLLINSAILSVLKLSTRKAVLLTPTLLVLSAYLTKVVYGILL